MVELKRIKELEDYQLRELEEEKLFINKYDLDLKYSYELNVYWKEFFFDMLEELIKNKNQIIIGGTSDKLFDYLKENYYNIIKEYNLKIDIRDYIDLTDYITLKEWEADNNKNIVLSALNKFYLVQF